MVSGIPIVGLDYAGRRDNNAAAPPLSPPIPTTSLNWTGYLALSSEKAPTATAALGPSKSSHAVWRRFPPLVDEFTLPTFKPNSGKSLTANELPPARTRGASRVLRDVECGCDQSAAARAFAPQPCQDRTQALSPPPACRPGRGKAIIEYGMTVRMTEAEVARDLHTVLEKVRQGVEVVIEQDSRPVAVIKAPVLKGRKLSEIIAALEASGANAVMDDDFARDVEEGIRARSQPWNPPSWD